MSAQHLDGAALARTRRLALCQRVERLKKQGVQPRLGVILSTRDGATLSYLEAKRRAAEKLGIEMVVESWEAATTADVASRIEGWACESAISGIMVEAPVAPAVDLDVVRRALPAEKDVDGAGTASLGLLVSGCPIFAPATAEAALMLCETVTPLAGKRVVVLGRSLVVGRPLALLALAQDATVTVCHSKTKNLPSIAREADVLFVAVGSAGFVGEDMVKPGAVVIDIGTNWVEGKLVGDVDAAAVETIAGALSPVPGGVGPVTTTLLLEHVVRAEEQRSV